MADTGATSLGGAANIQGPIHVDTYLPGGGKPKGQYPRRRKFPRDEDVGKVALKTLYVSRPVINALDIIAWAKGQGFVTTLLPGDLHVTLAFSRAPVDWSLFTPEKDELLIPAARPRDGARFVTRMGDGDCVALRFYSPALQARWRQFCNLGASWDWPEFNPHVTISWNAPEGIEAVASPYLGPILLGPEKFAEIKEDWQDTIVEKVGPMDDFTKNLGDKAGPDDYIDDFVNSDNPRFKDKSKEERIRMALGAYYSNKSLDWSPSDGEVKAWLNKIEKAVARPSGDRDLIQKVHDHAVALGAACGGLTKIDRAELKKARVNDELGLVMGYAIICKVNGTPYYDLNLDSDGRRVPEHIPEEAMLKAAANFMSGGRPGNEMHRGPDRGTFLFAFPLTSDVAKAMAIQTPVTGLLVAYKAPPDVLAKFKDGTYRGFSIEGRRVAFEEHE